jgi:hypothetical protein
VHCRSQPPDRTARYAHFPLTQISKRADLPITWTSSQPHSTERHAACSRECGTANGLPAGNSVVLGEQEVA